jgi:hypothetical protein
MRLKIRDERWSPIKTKGYINLDYYRALERIFGRTLAPKFLDVLHANHCSMPAKLHRIILAEKKFLS